MIEYKSGKPDSRQTTCIWAQLNTIVVGVKVRMVKRNRNPIKNVQSSDVQSDISVHVLEKF